MGNDSKPKTLAISLTFLNLKYCGCIQCFLEFTPKSCCHLSVLHINNKAHVLLLQYIWPKTDFRSQKNNFAENFASLNYIIQEIQGSVAFFVLSRNSGCFSQCPNYTAKCPLFSDHRICKFSPSLLYRFYLISAELWPVYFHQAKTFGFIDFQPIDLAEHSLEIVSLKIHSGSQLSNFIGKKSQI